MATTRPAATTAPGICVVNKKKRHHSHDHQKLGCGGRGFWTIVLEGRRPAKVQSKDWIDRQRLKIDRGVAELSGELGERTWCNGEAYSLADIATGCALGYLDFRQPSIDWRGGYPNLVKLAEKLAKRSSFADSLPPAGA